MSAGMAHEIRNPLVAIRTFAELAPSRLDDPEFRSNFLTVVREEIMRIDKLVGDLLTLSKPADAVVEEVDVELVCRGVMRAMAGVAESETITLNLQLDETQEVLKGDETRLYQALLNLVSNAIDAEPEGGSVTLNTQVHDGPRGDRRLCISVHNPSSFIPEDQTEEIWRPFVSRKAKGTGLGLAICQTIIEEHNGYVSVESTVDGGTTFVVELPLPSRTTAATSGEF
ncbi:MAG: HAMP domain-containing sensor histidine kinase [Armatimonadota bacterium]